MKHEERSMPQIYRLKVVFILFSFRSQISPKTFFVVQQAFLKHKLSHKGTVTQDFRPFFA